MVIFGPKQWVSHFGKMSIFRLFLTSCFYSLEGRSFVLEYCERHFPCLHCLKKQVGLMVIFGQKPSVNPFKKMSIFDVLNLFFYSLETSFFVLEYRKRHFPCLYCLKQKVEKNSNFWTKTMG